MENSVAEHYKKQIAHLTEIGISLSVERHLDALLSKTMHYARDLTNADAGSLYMLEDGYLRFRILQNASLRVFRGGPGEDRILLDPVPMEKSNVSAHAALLGRTVRIDDVYESEEFDFSGPRRYDKTTGYRSQSMLVVPMKNHEGDVIGVVQLINATDPKTKEVTGFTDESATLAESLASQAAVAIENNRLLQETKNLFESLIRVMATAVDQKSHYTGNHVERVARLNVILAQAVNQRSEGPLADVRFSEKEMEEIRLAGWLHDVGKIVTPSWVMDKATKLEAVFDRIALVETRYALMQALRANEALRRAGGDALEADDDMLSRDLDALREEEEFVRGCNQPGQFMEDERIERVCEIAARTFALHGEERPVLTEDEARNLCIRRGTLTDDEMQIMRDHVVVTEQMLEEVPFKGHLQNVPLYAAQHHEKMNGKGYPKGITAKDLPLQSRILAVADFYESLAAKDRPYKKPLSEEQIFSIMQRSADEGEIDPEVLKLLTEDKAHYRLDESAGRVVTSVNDL